ncbi:MAG: hypothetical protein ACOX1I_04280 [Dethiobacteria bacterium]|jgi:response regulator of citrate/malate metabolism
MPRTMLRPGETTGTVLVYLVYPSNSENRPRGSLKEAMELYAADYITKPLHVERFKETLNHYRLKPVGWPAAKAA